MRHDFEILIAGGGMVGAALALALAPLGLRVGVVEARAAAERRAPGYDDRSTALSAGSRRMLEAIGVWPALAAAAAPIRRVRVSEAGRAGSAVLDAAELALDALGWVVENPALQQALDDALAAHPAIERMQPASVAGLAEAGETIAVSIGSRTLHARLLVGADGANSAVRGFAGIGSSAHDYGQTAIVANFTPALDHDGVAWERFTPDGPFAVLPLPRGRCALVWSVPADEADAVLALDDAAFGARVAASFGGRLGGIERVGRRQAWPLQRVLADEQHRGRVALIGNAAHSLHPIAGQGFNLSLRDAAALAEAIVAGMAESGDPADAGVLARWVDERRADQRRVGGFTDRLNALFLADWPALGPLRGAGLAAFGLSGSLRRWFSRYGAGTQPPLPKLVRGVPLR